VPPSRTMGKCRTNSSRESRRASKTFSQTVEVLVKERNFAGLKTVMPDFIDQQDGVGYDATVAAPDCSATPTFSKPQRATFSAVRRNPKWRPR
jgi:hypothetical protein